MIHYVCIYMSKSFPALDRCLVNPSTNRLNLTIAETLHVQTLPSNNIPNHITPPTMSYSLYDATIPVAKNALKSLSNILKKGEAAPNGASLLAARIYEDMLPLTFQVFMVTDTSIKIAARLQGVEPHAWEGKIETYADCYSRIAKAEEILAAADKDLINKRQTETVPLGLGSRGTVQIPGASYANGYFMPTILFHLTTAYNILRKEGVPLGKTDYMEAYSGSFA
ncbi:hypothetical protein GGI43DRAFT_410643 [Trichoderma evansii]